MAARIASRDGASTAVRGFRVFGSARSETTSRPPRCPISPGTASDSPATPSCVGTPLVALENKMAVVSNRPQPNPLLKVESLTIVTICSRYSSSLYSVSRRLVATYSPNPSTPERRARLPKRAGTSTSKTPGRCIAEDLQGGCPSLALVRAPQAPERRGSSPRARIGARGSPPASGSHSKFPGGYDAEGDSYRSRRSPLPLGRNRALARSEPLRARAVRAVPILPPL